MPHSPKQRMQLVWFEAFLLHWYKDLLGKSLQWAAPDESDVCSRDKAKIADMTLQTKTETLSPCMPSECIYLKLSCSATHAHVPNSNIYSCSHYHKTNTGMPSTGRGCGMPARLWKGPASMEGIQMWEKVRKVNNSRCMTVRKPDRKMYTLNIIFIFAMSW